MDGEVYSHTVTIADKSVGHESNKENACEELLDSSTDTMLLQGITIYNHLLNLILIACEFILYIQANISYNKFCFTNICLSFL